MLHAQQHTLSFMFSSLRHYNTDPFYASHATSWGSFDRQYLCILCVGQRKPSSLLDVRIQPIDPAVHAVSIVRIIYFNCDCVAQSECQLAVCNSLKLQRHNSLVWLLGGAGGRSGWH